ncbi:hypothetical protein R1sor_001974 [Riccia sorocarpa]|uniref:MATE efflux family protein n=1 Tax=Riccia sorocarpa TaxID=122646 RepID=A0ABD3H003_9MARC
MDHPVKVKNFTRVLRFISALVVRVVELNLECLLQEGLSGGLETSGGRAYGNGQPRLLGYLLQRGQFVLVMFCLPISILWMHAAWVLRHWGQEYEIAALAGHYVIFLLPGLFATALYLPITRFLQVQGVIKPSAVIAAMVLIFHAPLCWLYIHRLGFGVMGAAAANSTSNVLTLLLLVLFLSFERSGILQRTWSGWSRKAFKKLLPFLNLALPACAVTSFQWWVWEIVQIMAGWLPNPEITVSATTISFQTVGLLFMLPLGLGAAASVRVSNELGAQRPAKAKLATRVALRLATVMGVVLAVLLFAEFGQDFSSTALIQWSFKLLSMLHRYWLFRFRNRLQCSILRGSGQQCIGSIINNVALYRGAIPLAYFLGIKRQMGVRGLWLGMMTGILLQLVGQILVAVQTDWEYQAKRAQETVKSNAALTDIKSADY